jgi:hypothetical protein
VQSRSAHLGSGARHWLNRALSRVFWEGANPGPSTGTVRDETDTHAADYPRLAFDFTMPASDTGGSVRRRRVRRRRQDKSALAARLVLDDHVKTDVGIVSEDVFAELFPHLQDCVSSYGVPFFSTTFVLMLCDQLTTKATEFPTSRAPYTLPSPRGHPPTPPSPRTGQ